MPDSTSSSQPAFLTVTQLEDIRARAADLELDFINPSDLRRDRQDLLNHLDAAVSTLGGAAEQDDITDLYRMPGGYRDDLTLEQTREALAREVEEETMFSDFKWVMLTDRQQRLRAIKASMVHQEPIRLLCMAGKTTIQCNGVVASLSGDGSSFKLIIGVDMPLTGADIVTDDVVGFSPIKLRNP